MFTIQEQCAQYWPDSVNSPEKNGSLSIELLSEKQFEDHTLRELKVSDVTVSDYKHFNNSLDTYSLHG